VARKYAFNSPKIRFQKYYINCHRQVILFVFFKFDTTSIPRTRDDPLFPCCRFIPTRRQDTISRAQPASQDAGSCRRQNTISRAQPVRTQALASLRTRGHRRTGNGSRDLEGTAGQVQAPASSRTRGHRRPGSGSRDLPSRSIRSRVPARGASTGIYF
jgi:hypothetical protein